VCARSARSLGGCGARANASESFREPMGERGCQADGIDGRLRGVIFIGFIIIGWLSGRVPGRPSDDFSKPALAEETLQFGLLIQKRASCSQAPK